MAKDLKQKILWMGMVSSARTPAPASQSPGTYQGEIQGTAALVARIEFRAIGLKRALWVDRGKVVGTIPFAM